MHTYIYIFIDQCNVIRTISSPMRSQNTLGDHTENVTIIWFNKIRY